MRKFYFASVVIAIGLLVAAAAMTGGRIVVFLSVPSAALVLLPAFVLSLTTHSFAEIVAAYRVGFQTQAGADRTSWRKDLEVARIYHLSFGRYVIASGIFGTFLGIVVMLVHINSDIDTVGRGFSVSLLTILYSVFFYIVLVVPFRAGIERRLAELS